MAARTYRFALLVLALIAAALGATFIALGLKPAPAIGLAIGLVVGSHALILGVEMLFAAIINPRYPLPSSYTVTGTGNSLTAWLVEVPSAWRTFGWAIPWRASKPVPSGRSANQVPILLVHGFTCNRAVWLPLASWLGNRGHPIATVNLEPLSNSIDQYAAQIDDAVNRFQSQVGSEKIALIGHSMGGVAIRAYLRDFGTAKTRQVITLGSPHQGTWIARFSPASNAKQLRFESEWLSQLSQSETGCYRRSIFNNYKRARQHHIPGGEANNARIPGGFFSGNRHVDMLYRQSIWHCIAQELDRTAEK